MSFFFFGYEVLQEKIVQDLEVLQEICGSGLLRCSRKSVDLLQEIHEFECLLEF